jgi:hypothetical protein
VAFTRVQSAVGVTGSPSATLGSAVTAGNLVAVWVTHQYGGSPFTTAAVNDNKSNPTYTLLGTVTVTASLVHHLASLFALQVPTGGSGFTVTYTPPAGSTSAVSVAVAEYTSGGLPVLEASSPVSAIGSGTSLSSGSQTLVGPSDLVLAIGTAAGITQTWTAGGSLVSVYSAPGTSSIASMGAFDQIGVAGGAFTATMTDSVTSAWACLAVGFRSAFTSMTVTEGHDALAASGTFVRAALVAVTEGHDALAAAGLLTEHGSIAKTEAHDVFAASGVFHDPATAALTEHHDTLAAAGLLTEHGSIARTEAHDTLAASGFFHDAGVGVLTEGHDLFAGISASTHFTLSRAEAHDLFAASGVMTSGTTLAAQERRDTFAAFAQVFPFIQGAEKHDVFAASGLGVVVTGATAVMARTEGHDVFAASGGFTFDVVATLHPQERHDVFAGVAAQSSAGALGVIEGHDHFAGSTHVTAAGTLGLVEAHDVFRGGHELVAYHVYANTGLGDPINYGTPIDTTGGLTFTTAPLAFPGTWEFGVRAFYVLSGLEEQNLDCEVTIILDAFGKDITNRPLPPWSLRAFPTVGGGIRVEWIYPPTSGPKAPTGFHVYTGIGVPNYLLPAATVLYGSAIANSFVSNIAGFTDLTTYVIAVRAFNATAEEANVNTVTVTAIATGPAPVESLVGIATAEGP